MNAKRKAAGGLCSNPKRRVSGKRAHGWFRSSRRSVRERDPMIGLGRIPANGGAAPQSVRRWRGGKVREEA